MKIHQSSTHQDILDNVDHLKEAEYGMARLHPGKFDNYYLGVTLRALVRAIEVLQQEVSDLKRQIQARDAFK